MIGPWNLNGAVTGAESNVTPARSLKRLSSRHGFGTGLCPMIPAVHWFAERVHSPATGMGRTSAVPSCAVLLVSAPALPLVAPPERRQLEATRSVPTQLVDLRQAPVPCSY